MFFKDFKNEPFFHKNSPKSKLFPQTPAFVRTALGIMKKLKEISEKLELSPTQACIAWLQKNVP